MKLSTRGRYGVKAMFELAMHYGEGPISLKMIAESQKISEHYLEQLASSLKKSGLIESIRGAQGGYILAREPKEITIGDIIRVLEGPIAPVDCVNEDRGETLCQRSPECIARNIWIKMRDSITEVLDSVTLEDMRIEAKEQEAKGRPYMYYI